MKSCLRDWTGIPVPEYAGPLFAPVRTPVGSYEHQGGRKDRNHEQSTTTAIGTANEKDPLTGYGIKPISARVKHPREK
ncbi:hypothetical protein [uncultured Methanoregula sp.]|uniref:hypothetical protein n=1 Tax=uncultured Methanoregula sp. TaxID=1005933 RepID=UPI002AAB5EDC|nr:hypothetical protein [uncultured Methanoregula sp.]